MCVYRGGGGGLLVRVHVLVASRKLTALCSLPLFVPDVKSRVERHWVETDNGHQISMVVVRGPPETSHKTPLVLVHGFGGGAGIWCKNFDALSSDRTVYALDMIGFGRSSRPNFSRDASEVEAMFVSALEAWRRSLGLESFHLVGHSLGGFVAAAYSLRHPAQVQHLLLVDSWGMPERPDGYEEHHRQLPVWVKAIKFLLRPFLAFSGLRLVGPFGEFFPIKVGSPLHLRCINARHSFLSQILCRCCCRAF